MTETFPEGVRAIGARGPRAVEDRLLERLAALLDQSRVDPRLLARPVRVVVASSRLREHLAGRLVAERGAVAGVVIQTLHGVALEVLERAGEPVLRGDALFPVVVRRAARGEPALRAVLEPLEDGYGAVVAAVSDLLDAGFAPDVPAHREALAEAVAESGLPGPTRERVAAVVRAAGSAARAMHELGVGRTGDRLARAAERLRADPGLAPARAIFVHGYADATGVASDLLETLARACSALVCIDLPPDPAHPEREDLGVSFAERLLDRVGAGRLRDADPPAFPPAALTGLRAVGSDAEVRAVAERVHALLAGGVSPERIGVVARDTAGYAVPVRTQFGRLGIPFSAPGTAGPPTGHGRRLHALLALLAEGDATPADRWLDALATLGRARRADLRLGLHAMGTARLRDLAALDPDPHLDSGDALPLPARRGLVAGSQESGAPAHVRRRRLSGHALRGAVATAVATAARLAAWPRRAALAEHVAALNALVREELGWRAGGERDSLEAALAELETQLARVLVSFDEFVLLARRTLAEADREPLGGAGAGVRFLGVVDARAHTFEHLFVLGVNRDVFPRPLLEDPLFPDAVRRPLAALLPEIPLKSRSFEEEHYLFAQLLAASPKVTLSWQIADDAGRARTPSPFVERLRAAGVFGEPEDAPGPYAPPRPGDARPRTACEATAIEGLYGSSERFAELLALGAAECDELDPAGSAVAPEAIARGRCAVLEELGDRPGRAELGPYFGFVGGIRHAADVRRADLYVTQMERMVRCPWQVFLTRLLRLEPPPDALDSLPELTPLLLGNLVHRVLERIVAEAVEAAEAGAGVQVPWPDDAALEALLRSSAEELVQREGIGLPGFARVLLEAARPLLLPARELEWPAPGSPVACTAVEAQGGVDVGCPPRRIHFRADRVDRVAGVPRLVDYKTGRPRTQKKLAQDVAHGSQLQAAAYAFGSEGEGRYLYLAAGATPGAVVEAAADDAALRAAFERAVAIALAAFDAGAFFPRLCEPHETGPARHCDWCEVRQACLQGDASARARLAAWSQSSRRRSPAEADALALWQLYARPSG